MGVCLSSPFFPQGVNKDWLAATLFVAVQQCSAKPFFSWWEDCLICLKHIYDQNLKPYTEFISNLLLLLWMILKFVSLVCEDAHIISWILWHMFTMPCW